MTLTQIDQNHKTQIRYNRSRRTWEAVNGVVTDCLSKTDALMVALQHDQPDMAAVVIELIRIHHDSNPTITNGLLKGAKLIIADLVYDNGEVGSQSRDDYTHQVTFDGQYNCSCEATVTDPILGKICAHCLARHIAYLADIELPAPPVPSVPFNGEPVVINTLDYFSDDDELPF